MGLDGLASCWEFKVQTEQRILMHALGASPRRRPRCDRRGAGGVGRRPSGLHRSHFLCSSAVLSIQLGCALATVAGLGFAGPRASDRYPQGRAPSVARLQ
jgi:hypothetical protein